MRRRMDAARRRGADLLELASVFCSLCFDPPYDYDEICANGNGDEADYLPRSRSRCWLDSLDSLKPLHPQRGGTGTGHTSGSRTTRDTAEHLSGYNKQEILNTQNHNRELWPSYDDHDIPNCKRGECECCNIKNGGYEPRGQENLGAVSCRCGDTQRNGPRVCVPLPPAKQTPGKDIGSRNNLNDINYPPRDVQPKQPVDLSISSKSPTAADHDERVIIKRSCHDITSPKSPRWMCHASNEGLKRTGMAVAVAATATEGANRLDRRPSKNIGVDMQPSPAHRHSGGAGGGCTLDRMTSQNERFPRSPTKSLERKRSEPGQQNHQIKDNHRKYGRPVSGNLDAVIRQPTPSPRNRTPSRTPSRTPTRTPSKGYLQPSRSGNFTKMHFSTNANANANTAVNNYSSHKLRSRSVDLKKFASNSSSIHQDGLAGVESHVGSDVERDTVISFENHSTAHLKYDSDDNLGHNPNSKPHRRNSRTRAPQPKRHQLDAISDDASPSLILDDDSVIDSAFEYSTQPSLLSTSSSQISAAEKEREKERLSKLVKAFARRALSGITQQIVDVNTGEMNRVMFRMDRTLMNFFLETMKLSGSFRGDQLTGKTRSFRMAKVNKISTGRAVHKEHSHISRKVLSACVAVELISPREVLLFYFSDPIEREEFITSLKILRMSVDICNSKN